MQPTRVLVTGTTRGLGELLVGRLLKLNPEVHVIAFTRENPEATEANWKKAYPNGNIRCLYLELGQQQCLEDISKYLKDNKFIQNVIVNNAADVGDCLTTKPTIEGANRVMKVNFFGTVNFTTKLLPFLAADGRVVNVSSKLGALNNHPPHTKAKYSRPDITFEEIRDGARQFIRDVQKGEQGKHWFEQSYGTSKMLLNSWSRFVLQKKLMGPNQKAICMSPGRCNTVMGSIGAMHTAESGAEQIWKCMWMQNFDKDLFYHRGTPVSYEACGVGDLN